MFKNGSRECGHSGNSAMSGETESITLHVQKWQ